MAFRPRKGAKTKKKKKKPGFGGASKGQCRFCRSKRSCPVDYKDMRTLQKLTTSQGKLFSRKRSGNCAKHQRQFRRAAKRARFLALLAYTGRH